MNEKTKRKLKTVGIVGGIGIIGALFGLSYVGLGLIFQEQYHDPEGYLNTIGQCARYGWSVKLKNGWAA